mmetsp:Transcript_18279/g.53264  ORF Transcript_18279/g.53264 Transcript_18279/m.53264 type:complete len:422 (+) Transcript_18279:290-1555(+)
MQKNDFYALPGVGPVSMLEALAGCQGFTIGELLDQPAMNRHATQRARKTGALVESVLAEWRDGMEGAMAGFLDQPVLGPQGPVKLREAINQVEWFTYAPPPRAGAPATRPALLDVTNLRSSPSGGGGPAPPVPSKRPRPARGKSRRTSSVEDFAEHDTSCLAPTEPWAIRALAAFKSDGSVPSTLSVDMVGDVARLPSLEHWTDRVPTVEQCRGFLRSRGQQTPNEVKGHELKDRARLHVELELKRKGLVNLTAVRLRDEVRRAVAQDAEQELRGVVVLVTGPQNGSRELAEGGLCEDLEGIEEVHWVHGGVLARRLEVLTHTLGDEIVQALCGQLVHDGPEELLQHVQGGDECAASCELGHAEERGSPPHREAGLDHANVEHDRVFGTEPCAVATAEATPRPMGLPGRRIALAVASRAVL